MYNILYISSYLLLINLVKIILFIRQINVTYFKPFIYNVLRGYLNLIPFLA